MDHRITFSIAALAFFPALFGATWLVFKVGDWVTTGGRWAWLRALMALDAIVAIGLVALWLVSK